MKLLSELGRDAFHRVPNSFRKYGDAVERVPTRFMVQRAEIVFGEVPPQPPPSEEERERFFGHAIRFAKL